MFTRPGAADDSADSSLADSSLADSSLADSSLADSSLADSSLADSSLADSVLDRLAPVIVGPPAALRVVLIVASLAQLALALPWLVGADPLGVMGDASTAHLTRDGALGLAVASAGLLTAWRPRYAIAAALVSLAALVAQVATALIDDHYRRVSLLVEGTHAFTVLITVLVAVSSRPLKPLGKRQTRLRSIPGSQVD